MNRILGNCPWFLCFFTALVGCNKSEPGISLGALQQQNGGLSLVHAAELANKMIPKSLASTADKRSHLEAGAGALQLAREGLRGNRSFDEVFVSQPLADRFGQFRALFNLFRIEMELAQEGGEMEKALSACLEYTQLSADLAHGGNVASQLTSTAFLSRGAIDVHAMRESLTKSQCLRAIEALEGALAMIEPVRVVVERETGTFDYSDGSVERSLILSQERNIKECRARLELCKADLAIRAYRLTQGRLPTTLDDLVGSELQSIPIDPWTGDSVVYRSKGEVEYVIHAVGPSGEFKL